MSKLRAKKRLGQNFLITSEIISKIINPIAPKPSDTIVEIGPGKGALTKPLAESGATVFAVEFDRDMCAYLKKEFEKFKNVTILQSDFLRFVPAEYGLKSFKLCGNLPFNISSPVIDWIVYHRAMVTQAVLMLQKEVAQRLSSGPGGKQWSPLAIFTQLYFEIELLFDVSPKHFKPQPEVTSAVVELKPNAAVEIKNFKQFEEVVRTSFKQRRKQLINNLVPAMVPSVKAAEEIFWELGLRRNVRAEEVDTEQFLELTEALTKHNMI